MLPWTEARLWRANVARWTLGEQPVTAVTHDRTDYRLAWRVLAVAALASVVVSLNSSLLNIALPIVVRHFNAGNVAASWILLSFTLPSTVLLIVLGRVADTAGRAEMYLVGIALFGGSSLLLGLAPNVGVLIALRIVEAGASAMIMVNSVALIIDVTPKQILTRGLGIYNASFAVAQVLGPTVGALVVHLGGWRWIFWINVPVAALCYAMARLTLHRAPPHTTARGIPVRSATSLMAALSLVIFAISDTPNVGWSSGAVWGSFIGAAVCFLVYIRSELRPGRALVDWQLIWRASLLSPLTAALAFTLAQFSLALLVGLYFEGVRGEDPIRAGLRLLPLPIATSIAAASVGLLARLMGARMVAFLGLCISAAGLLVAAMTLSESSGYLHISLLLALIGCGGMFLPANTTVVFSRVAEGNLAVVNSIRLLIQNLGLALSTAITLTVIAAPVSAALRRHVLAGTISAAGPAGSHQLMVGYHHVLYLLFAFAALGAVATISRSRRPPQGEGESVNRDD